jgi:hypothetical protein
MSNSQSTERELLQQVLQHATVSMILRRDIESVLADEAPAHAEQPDLLAALGLMERVKNALSGPHINEAALEWITGAKEIVRAAAEAQSKTVEDTAKPSAESRVKAALADVQSVRAWINNIHFATEETKTRQRNAAMQLNFVEGVLLSLPQDKVLPATDDVVVPRDLAQHIVGLLKFVRTHSGGRYITERQQQVYIKPFQDIVFPPTTRTIHVEVTGSSSTLDQVLKNIRVLTTEYKDVEASISEDTE